MAVAIVWPMRALRLGLGAALPSALTPVTTGGVVAAAATLAAVPNRQKNPLRHIPSTLVQAKPICETSRPCLSISRANEIIATLAPRKANQP